MRTTEWLAASCIVLFIAATTVGEDAPTVGSLGRAEKVVIVGCKTFSPEDIREALFNDLDVIATCEPDRLLSALKDEIAKKTLAGYREAGFCDAGVSVDADDGKLVVTITEGVRFTNGEIQVSGNSEIDLEKLKVQFTSRQTNGEKRRPVWQVNEPARFGPVEDARLTSRASTGAEDQGFYRANLKVAVEPDHNTNKAVLRIDIGENASLSTLGDVEMMGNKRNSRDAVLAYLGLDATAPLTRDRREEIERRLAASGRFLDVRWELGKFEERGDSWRPRLALKEYELAPRLDEPLSREATGLLKAAEWFERLHDSKQELLLQDGNGKGAIVFAPQRGVIVLLKVWDDDAAATGMASFTHAIVMDEERVGLYSRAQRRKLVGQPPPSPLVAEAVFNLVGEAPQWDGDGVIKFGAGFDSQAQRGDSRHVSAQAKLSAPAALSLLYKHKADCRWDGDVLSLESDKYRLRINALTGQLIDHAIKGDAQSDGDPMELNTRLAFRPGEFERRLREIEEASADWPNVADASRPLTCVCEFLCAELEKLNAYSAEHAGDDRHNLIDAEFDPCQAELMRQVREEMAANSVETLRREQRGYAAIRKAISLGLLEPCDQLLLGVVQAPEERFCMPLPLFHVRLNSFDELPSLARELAPLFGVRAGNVIFPVEGWMNSAWRLGLLAAAKKPFPFRRRLHGPTADDKHGPLSALVEAELLRLAGADFESRMYALDGCQVASIAAYRDECLDLVSGEGFVSQFLLKAADVARQLDVIDAEALPQFFEEWGCLNATQATALELAMLRAQRETSARSAAIEALNALWRAGLESWIERRLKELGIRH